MSILMNQVAEEFNRLHREIASLKLGLKEAIKWNWLEDDAPEAILEELEKLLNEE